MKITFLGHAGFYVETKFGSVLCDPWFNPAYFASWFPFPRNDHLDKTLISKPKYLYLSHLHFDHYDPEFLRDHVWKDAIVLLPDYPLPLLERAYRELGFHQFIRTKNREAVEHEGLRFILLAMTTPMDGPLGDSSIIIDDGETRIIDQNDSRPIDFETIGSYGPYNAHLVQFSGAIWYPMVYRFPQKMSLALGAKKRENEMARALRFIQETGATHIVPSAGPPCFLDPDLYHINDFQNDPTNTFPDQTIFIDYLREHGKPNAHLMLPGSVMLLNGDECSVEHPIADEAITRLFTHKKEYLDQYQQDMLPLLDSIKASWPRGQVHIPTALKEWFEPLMQSADHICVGINGKVILDCGEQAVVLDFQKRLVYPWDRGEWDYYYKVDSALLESLIIRHQEDWVNDLFLSCRFEAERHGPYNEYIYVFFKGLSMERIAYIDGYYAELSSDDQFFEKEGYRIQRRCPHLKADLTRFGSIQDGVLTCSLHNWQFELDTGKCITSNDRVLYAKKLSQEGSPDAQEDIVWIKPRALKCGHCWYRPEQKGR